MSFPHGSRLSPRSQIAQSPLVTCITATSSRPIGQRLERVLPRPSANRSHCPRTRAIASGPSRHVTQIGQRTERVTTCGEAPLQTRLIAAGAIAESGVLRDHMFPLATCQQGVTGYELLAWVSLSSGAISREPTARGRPCAYRDGLHR